MKPKYVVWIIVAAVLLPLGAYLITADQPGKTERAGDVITKTLGTANANASATFDITLQEGGDPAHESDHVFEAVKLPAVESATFNIATSKMEVRYDSAQIDEPTLGSALAMSGYMPVAAEDATEAALAPDGKSQTLTLQQGEQALEPRYMRAKAGVTLKLVFGPGSGHLASVAIAELNIAQDLSQGGTTVEINDPKPGTYQIICAEGYEDGTLVVE